MTNTAVSVSGCSTSSTATSIQSTTDYYVGLHTERWFAAFALSSMGGASLRLIIATGMMHFLQSVVLPPLLHAVASTAVYNILGAFIFGLVETAHKNELAATFLPLPSDYYASSRPRFHGRTEASFTMIVFFLKTAFCGSLTSFSAVVLAANNSLQSSSSPTISTAFSAAVAVAITLLLPILALRLGSASSFLLSNNRAAFFSTALALTFAPLVFGTLLFASIDRTLARAVLSVLIAPAGALSRYALSLSFNKRFEESEQKVVRFSGTLLANLLANFIVLGIAGGEEADPSLLLIAICDGFAGSLSTVSSFVGELSGGEMTRANLANSLVYFCFTIVAAVGVGRLAVYSL